MNDLPTLYRRPTEAEIWADDPRWDETGMVPVEPVGVVEMVDHIDGWFTVLNVYAPDLPEASYRVAIVVVEADDE